MLSAGRFLMVVYSGKHYVLDLSLIKLSLSIFIWMCHFPSIVSLGVYLDS